MQQRKTKAHIDYGIQLDVFRPFSFMVHVCTFVLNDMFKIAVHCVHPVLMHET